MHTTGDDERLLLPALAAAFHREIMLNSVGVKPLQTLEVMDNAVAVSFSSPLNTNTTSLQTGDGAPFERNRDKAEMRTSESLRPHHIELSAEGRNALASAGGSAKKMKAKEAGIAFLMLLSLVLPVSISTRAPGSPLLKPASAIIRHLVLRCSSHQ